MGAKEISPSNLFFLKDFYDEIENSIKSKTDLNVNNTIKQLSSFCLSNEFSCYLYFQFFWEEPYFPFCDLIAIYEMKEKFFSFKIFLPLLEELKLNNFEKEFNIDITKIGENLLKIAEEFKNDLNKFGESEKRKKDAKEINQFLIKNISYIKALSNIYGSITYFMFCDLINKFLGANNNQDNKILKQQLCSLFEYYRLFKDIFNEDLYDYLLNVDIKNLNYTRDIYQIIIFILNIIKNVKENIDGKYFNIYGGVSDLNDKLLYTFYEEGNESNSEGKIIKIVLEGKITEKEKFNFDMFKSMDTIKEVSKLKGINSKIFESIFVRKKIVLKIKLDLKYLKENNSSIEHIMNEIKEIEKYYSSKYNNLYTYIQIEKRIINLNASYEQLIQELKNNKIIEKNNNDISEKILKDNNSVKIDKQESLIEELKKELTEEKEKNKTLEKIIKESGKESILNTFIEKDKEIKELKLKLSRYPFNLEEGEKLMTINFITPDQKLHHSVICKNTDEFHQIETQLYKSHPELFKNEVNFISNGKKINRYETLEKNGIKNNEVIVLQEIK